MGVILIKELLLYELLLCNYAAFFAAEAALLSFIKGLNALVVAIPISKGLDFIHFL
jgi:hypothetical protein